MTTNGIQLTPQELEDLKDDIKFRTSMTIYMKELKGIPQRVCNLEVHRNLHWFFLSGIIVSILWFKFI